MRIVQLLSTIAFGDAVGNDTIAIRHLLEEMGYDTDIYAQNIDPRLKKGTAKKISHLPKLNKKDIILYHMSTGTDLNYHVADYPGRKIMVYHNITPCEYFYGYSRANYDLTYLGREELKFLKDKVERCFADSEFNKADLLETGYQCPIDILPIIVPFDDYKKAPNEEILKQYDDDWVNILFVGRIAPNKKHEDIIRAFAYYKTYINQKSRLFLVGSYSGTEAYYRQLQHYVNKLEISDVIFTGHTKFDQILAYYKMADVFLCMSEHEGFCVPLLEAMYFNVPIIAYKAAAIPDTMGNSGIVIDEKDPAFTAKLIERLLTDADFRQAVISGQQSRLKDFSYERTKETFKKLIAGCI